MISSMIKWVRDKLLYFKLYNVSSMAEEFVEKLEKYKTEGMTEEQVITAKDIRRRGKNKVGCAFFFIFNVYLLMPNLLQQKTLGKWERILWVMVFF